MPARSFITNGPYWATGSPIGRPCSTSTSAPVARARRRSVSQVTTPPSPTSTRRRCTDRLGRAVEHVDDANRVGTRWPQASSNSAPGSSRTCQIATSLSGRDAHDAGGGAAAPGRPRSPATTVISASASRRRRAPRGAGCRRPTASRSAARRSCRWRAGSSRSGTARACSARRGRAAGTSRCARCPCRR